MSQLLGHQMHLGGQQDQASQVAPDYELLVDSFPRTER